MPNDPDLQLHLAKDERRTDKNEATPLPQGLEVPRGDDGVVNRGAGVDGHRPDKTREKWLPIAG